MILGQRRSNPCAVAPGNFKASAEWYRRGGQDFSLIGGAAAQGKLHWDYSMIFGQRSNASPTVPGKYMPWRIAVKEESVSTAPQVLPLVP